MRLLLILLTTLAAAAVMATTGNAWHATDVQVTPKCNPTTGVYDITALIVQSQDWPGAFVKSVTPSSYPGSTAGTKTVVVVVAWSSSSETQTFTRTVTLDGSCHVVCEPVTVIREVPVDRIVYVDRVVEKPVDRVVEKVVEKVVYVPKVVVKTRTIVKWKTRTVVKWRTKVKTIHDRCEPPPDDPGCEGKCDWPKKYGGNG